MSLIESPFRTALAGGLQRLAERTGIAEDRLRRSFLLERLLTRLLADAPDRWVRFDDWRLEYRYDGPAAAYDASGGVSEHARAAVDAEMRRAIEHQGLEPVRLAVRHSDRWPQVSQGPALAYRVEAGDRDGEVGDVVLLVGFTYPAEDEIEQIAGLDVCGGPGRPPTAAPDTQSAGTDHGPLWGLHRSHGPLSRLPGPADHRPVCATPDLYGVPGASGAGAHVAVGCLSHLAARGARATAVVGRAISGRSRRAWTAPVAGGRSRLGRGAARSHPQQHGPTRCDMGSHGRPVGSKHRSRQSPKVPAGREIASVARRAP